MSFEEGHHPSSESQISSPDQVLVDAWRESRLDVGSEVIGCHEPCEDAILQDIESRTFGVFDGLSSGSHAALASSTAAEEIRDLNANDLDISDINDVVAFLKDCISEAHWKIREHMDDQNETEAVAMTTATVLRIIYDPEGAYKGVFANVGDSRGYILRASGEFEQITVDNVTGDTKDSEVAREHEWQQKDAERTLRDSQEDEGYFANRHLVYDTLGASDNVPNPRIVVTDLNEGDKIILTTDGVHDNLTATEIRSIMEYAMTGQEMSKMLSRAAYERSQDSSSVRAKRDDIGVVSVIVG